MIVLAQPAVVASAPACLPAQLGVRLGLRGGAAGTAYVAIVFVNRGAGSCSLRGYPGVSSVGAGGRQIGAPAFWEPARVVTVVLRAGGVASATYGQADARNYPRARCAPRAARGLRVYPPGATRARFLPLAHLACSSTAVGDSLVGPVVAGSS